jgi:hypothetical protein
VGSGRLRDGSGREPWARRCVRPRFRFWVPAPGPRAGPRLCGSGAEQSETPARSAASSLLVGPDPRAPPTVTVSRPRRPADACASAGLVWRCSPRAERETWPFPEAPESDPEAPAAGKAADQR